MSCNVCGGDYHNFFILNKEFCTNCTDEAEDFLLFLEVKLEGNKISLKKAIKRAGKE